MDAAGRHREVIGSRALRLDWRRQTFGYFADKIVSQLSPTIRYMAGSTKILVSGGAPWSCLRFVAEKIDPEIAAAFVWLRNVWKRPGAGDEKPFEMTQTSAIEKEANIINARDVRP